MFSLLKAAPMSLLSAIIGAIKWFLWAIGWGGRAAAKLFFR